MDHQCGGIIQTNENTRLSSPKDTDAHYLIDRNALLIQIIWTYHYVFKTKLGVVSKETNFSKMKH